ncbi:MAG: LysM domain-containing protein, partial [Thermodesulfovibrionales bacterium]|nr:LysM domain-containing protein [Thermodesulfovibrionales bacterium]
DSQMKRFCLAAAILLIFSAYANADVTYTIKKGDTLSRVSKKINVSAKEIRSLNNLKKSAKLRIGQTLIVKKTVPRTYTV